ncbi:MAG TPA: chemotaxis-specific protein-glutamate methyltransferase CheB [Bryobacteraceae bacterium]|nr:chemotaxis-specific protein-glutamate methyltransferase CheB [Bryobacteraceae bacterium]
MKKIHVLVVEDSITVRKRIVAVLGADADMEVVGEAADGKTGIELCRKLRPDVVTLDMMLPVMTGLAATEYIMAYCPTPILIVSASTNRGELFRTYSALAAGAVDVLEKPIGDEPDGAWERKLISTVKLVSRIKVITHLQGRLNKSSSRALPELPSFPAGTAPGPYRLVGIGTSTGGPAACLEILRNLPPRFPLPILLVIHIGQAFGAALAEWLDSQSGIRVTCARDGEALPPVGEPRVLIAPPGHHLVLRQGRLRLTADPERHSCKPSVDVLFESLAQELAGQSIACLLTGMGRDGAAGLLAIRREGGRTLAQDQATSVVFGMPQEAIRIGAAERVLAIGQIAPALTALAGCDGREQV